MLRHALVLVAAVAVIPVVAFRSSPRTVVQASFDAVNRHDAAALAALYAPDAVVVSSAECQPQVGPEPVRAGHEALFKAMPDLTFTPKTWVVQGERVAVIFAAHSAVLGGERPFADFFTVRDGKIVRDITLFNAQRPCR